MSREETREIGPVALCHRFNAKETCPFHGRRRRRSFDQPLRAFELLAFEPIPSFPLVVGSICVHAQKLYVQKLLALRSLSLPGRCERLGWSSIQVWPAEKLHMRANGNSERLGLEKLFFLFTKCHTFLWTQRISSSMPKKTIAKESRIKEFPLRNVSVFLFFLTFFYFFWTPKTSLRVTLCSSPGAH